LRGFTLMGLCLAGLVFGFETVGRGAVPLPVTIGLLVGGALCGGLYALHARRRANPAVDFTLMRFPTFRGSVFGGFLFRAGIGSMPFLLPMMLQLGFGMSALSSGLLTFASAAGAMTMKITAGPIIRTWGFRRVLIFNAIISSLFLMSYSLFGAGTPHLLIFLALLAGGFFRSLQFTSVNTLGYADIPPAQMSRATSFSSMSQQLSLSVGVGIGALALHLTILFHGGDAVSAADFMPAFITVGLVSLSSLLFFVRLPHDAGAEVSGHRHQAKPEQQVGPLEKQAAE